MCILYTFCFNCFASLYQLFPPHTLYFSIIIKKNRRQKVTKPLHPPAFHICSHHYRFHNIWMFNHPHTTKYHLFFDLRLLGDKVFYNIPHHLTFLYYNLNFSFHQSGSISTITYEKLGNLTLSYIKSWVNIG